MFLLRIFWFFVQVLWQKPYPISLLKKPSTLSLLICLSMSWNVKEFIRLSDIFLYVLRKLELFGKFYVTSCIPQGLSVPEIMDIFWIWIMNVPNFLGMFDNITYLLWISLIHLFFNLFLQTLRLVNKSCGANCGAEFLSVNFL